MTDKIRPPWTPEQVSALNRFQQYGGMHPFTCGGKHDGPSLILMAHRDGWHCSDPACGYRQNWAHAFMADPEAWPKPLLGVEPEPSDPTQCSGEEGFCPEHGFHRHSLKQPGEEQPACVHPDGYEGECPCAPDCRCCQAASPPRTYPHPDGDVTVLGPEVFASADGQTISWKGANYSRHPGEIHCMCGGISVVHEIRGAAGARDAHDGAEAAQGGSGDRLRCPYCSEDITDYDEDDHVFRTGGERPYCSGECVISAHRAARSDVGTEFVQQVDNPDEAGLAAVEARIPDGDIQQLAVAILRVQRLIDQHPIAVPTNLLEEALDHGAHDTGPSVAECAKADDEHWNTKYAGEGS